MTKHYKYVFSQVNFVKFIIILFSGIALSQSTNAATGLTLQGRIVRDSKAISASSVSFLVQIRSPGSENCLLYQETHTVDMSTSNGLFSLPIGSGTRAAASVDGGFSLTRIFSNRGALDLSAVVVNASNTQPCASGHIYTPAANDTRKVLYSFNDGKGSVALSPITISFNPMSLYALDSEAVGGFANSNLLRVENAGVPGSASALSTAQMTELMNIITGASVQYIKPGSAAFTAQPTFAGAPVNPSDLVNKAYVDAAASAGLPNTGTAGTYTKVTTDAQGRVVTGVVSLVAADIPNLDAAKITSGTIGGAVAMNTSGNIVTSATVTANTISGNALRAYNGALNYIELSAPVATSGAVNFKLPSSDGTAGQVLKTDGAGNWGWVSPTTGSVTTVSGTGAIASTGGSNPTISLITGSGLTQSASTVSVDAGLGVGKIPQVGGSALAANGVVVANGTGTVLASLNCTSGQVIKFDASGFAICGSDSVNAGTVTNVTSANAYITVGTGTSTPLITAVVGTASGQLAAGDDSRFTDSRAPNGSAGGDLTGTFPNPTLGTSGVTAATYGSATQVPVLVVDAKGRITSASNAAVNDSSKLPLAGGTMTGGIAMGGFNISGSGNVELNAGKYFGMGQYAADPTTTGWGSPEKGRSWFNTTSNTVKYWDGSAIQALGVSGAGLTSLGGQGASIQTFAAGSAGLAPQIDSAANVHTLNVPLASGAGVTSGTISKTDYDNFAAKQSALGFVPLNPANNLSDVSNASTARTNLGLGTAAVLNVGTGNNNVVQLDGTAKLPAVDGSQLTGFTAAQIPNLDAAKITTGTIVAARMPALTGDVTMAVGTTATSISGLARSKLASGTINHVIINDGSGVMSSEANLAVIRGGTGAGSFGNNSVIISNGTGSALSSLNCASGQVVKFDVSGFAVCGSDNSGTGDIINGGNTTGAAVAIGTNDAQSLNFETNNATKMTILSSGNVGIGITNPTDIFQVDATNTKKSITLKAGDDDVFGGSGGAGNVNITAGYGWNDGGDINLTTGFNDHFGGYSGTVNVLSAGIVSRVVTDGGGIPAGLDLEFGNGAQLNTGMQITFSAKDTAATKRTLASITAEVKDTGAATYKGDLYFHTILNGASSEKMRITSAGNVGIGTTTPGTSLTVAGQSSTATISNRVATAAPSFAGYRSNGTLGAPTAPAVNDILSQFVGYSYDAVAPGYIYAGGMNVTRDGGAAAPESINSYLTFNTGNGALGVAERMRIDRSGNVGIGTTAPGAPLDVKGAIRMSGSTSGYTGFKPAAAAGSTVWELPSADGTIDQVLKTNGAGVLSWTSMASGITGSGTSGKVPKFTAAGAIGDSAINDNATDVTFDKKIKFASGVGSITSAAAESLTLNSGSAAADQFVLSFDGKVGVGGAPSKPLELINGAEATFRMNSGNDTKFDFTVDRGASSNLVVSKVAGSGTSMVLSNVALDIGGISAPAASASGSSRMYFDSTSNTLKLSQHAGGYQDIRTGTVAVANGGTAATSFGNNSVILSNGTGSALTSLNCTSGQVIKFDVSGYAVCGSDTVGSGDIINGGNTTGAALTIGTNDAQSLSFETGNSTKMTILSSGEVGIGTASPGSVLEVAGNILLSRGTNRAIGIPGQSNNTSGQGLSIYAGNAGPAAMPGMLGGTGGDLRLYGGNSTAGATQGGSVFLFGGSDSSGIMNGNVILGHDGTVSRGNVGISTSNPLAKLDVSSGDNIAILIGADAGASTRTDATVKVSRMAMPHYTNAEEPVFLLGGTAGPLNNELFLGGGSAQANTSTQIRFFTASNKTTLIGTERMTIENNGNIGIGISNPSASLHVVGANSASGAAASVLTITGGLGGMNGLSGGAGAPITLTSGSGGFGAINGNTGGLFTIQAGAGGGPVSGNGGVGGGVSITAGAGGSGSSQANGGDVTINPGAGGTAGNVVIANLQGNVGIGTASPGAKLDVNGSVSMASTSEGVSSYTATGAAYTIPNTSVNIRRLTLDSNTTVTLPAFTAPAGRMYSLTVFLKQDATGSRTLSWAGGGSDTIKWDSATVPTISSTADKITIIQFIKAADETVWYGSMVWKEN